MTRLPAKVLSNEKRGDQRCFAAKIELSNFRRSFNSLRFGDQIPFLWIFPDVGRCPDLFLGGVHGAFEAFFSVVTSGQDSERSIAS
jgi:hypothetical protein